MSDNDIAEEFNIDLEKFFNENVETTFKDVLVGAMKITDSDIDLSGNMLDLYVRISTYEYLKKYFKSVGKKDIDSSKLFSLMAVLNLEEFFNDASLQIKCNIKRLKNELDNKKDNKKDNN